MIRFIFFEKRENLPILWNLVKLSKMKFHETSEIIFNFENLWNFLSLPLGYTKSSLMFSPVIHIHNLLLDMVIAEFSLKFIQLLKF